MALMNSLFDIRLKSCLVLVTIAGSLVLPGCGDQKQSAKNQSAAAEFATKFANEKSTAPDALPPEWVVLDKANNLMYRYNFHKYCLVIAQGKIERAIGRDENYIVTYSYRTALNTGNTANCPANEKACFEEIADCQKVTDLIISRHSSPLVATIPKSAKPEDALAQLKPARN